MFFSATVDTEDTAGHIDFAVEEAEGRNRELICVFGLAWIPLRWIPGDVYPVKTDLLAHRVGGNQDSSCVESLASHNSNLGKSMWHLELQPRLRVSKACLNTQCS